MNSAILALLERCTVRLLNHAGWQGTGFFVASPGIAVTCAHVVRTGDAGIRRNNRQWRGEQLSGVLTLMAPYPCPEESIFRTWLS